MRLSLLLLLMPLSIRVSIENEGSTSYLAFPFFIRRQTE